MVSSDTSRTKLSACLNKHSVLGYALCSVPLKVCRRQHYYIELSVTVPINDTYLYTSARTARLICKTKRLPVTCNEYSSSLLELKRTVIVVSLIKHEISLVIKSDKVAQTVAREIYRAHS